MFVQLANISFCHRDGGLQTSDGDPPDAAPHNAFAWFYMGAAIVAVAAWFLLGNPQKAADYLRAVERSGLLGVVASGAGLFYVELRRYAGKRRDAGDHEQCARAGGAAGNLAIWQEQPHWPSFPIGGNRILASLWVHRRWSLRIRTNGRWSHAWFRAERINASVIG